MTKISNPLLEFINQTADNSSPLVKALILWTLHDHSQAQIIQQRLANDLLNTDWLKSNDLLTLCVVAGSLYAFEPKLVGGDIFARIAKQLLAAESAIGGPYVNKYGKVDEPTNRAVAFLMNNLGSPLPNVEAYLANFSPVVDDMILPVYPKSAALQTARNLRSKADKSETANKNSVAYDTIVKQAKREVARLSEPLQTSMRSMLEKLLAADKNKEMLLFPRFFASSLRQSLVTEKQLKTFGLASLYTWLSYTIFDDFLDDEGQPSLMPVATTSFQKALLYFAEVTSASNWRSLVLATFTTMDQANAWEVAHCRAEHTAETITFSRLPRYGQRLQLAQRSLAHALGPMLLTDQLDATKQQKQLVRLGLRHYLIARQLNDDIFDWRKDIAAGQISYVVALLLRSLHIKSGVYDLKKLIADMQHSLWQTNVKTICNQTILHIKTARRAFVDSRLFTSGQLFELLDDIEKIATQSLDSQIKQQDFLTTYKLQ